MMNAAHRAVVIQSAQYLSKADLIIQLIVALRQECYLYAGVLRDEIRRRVFSWQEVSDLRNSSFYPLLNGVLD